jgi:chromodomain-helicase-DNA-binding protein 7
MPNNEKDDKKLEEEPKEKDETEWEEEEIELEELFVKFKGFSYLHCEWKSVEELEEMGDKRVMAKLNRWKQKFGDTISGVGEEDEQEYFNEDYTVVARVLDETYDDREKQHYVSGDLGYSIPF